MSEIELKKEVIESAINYIDRMVIGIEGINGDFQEGREDKATNSMIQLIDGIQWLLQAIEGTRDIQGEVSIDISSMNPIFNQLIEALENTDYVLLGDLLEYEVTPVIKEWKDKLILVQRSLQ
ncbi:hypothetical protein [Acetivibrio clariflavus]|uniref:DUF8042 domain-containing protein n=1 Tax=Acetivibrio clariflavus (strain DSM 19732 / NBRC 101661 / EBR45) TaxID=720554 RepID=G8LTL4_ACECE|nr:hypothetical protein [Acetivibrio clariflavus]AEV70524.1 hypothetical protein Clocl_4090 [Acetivibrio clariflavus DSM 19732]